ncbi:MAG: radical SAM protein [Candidatus Thorarchaeota archaeon]|jgi:molybdenum cofactor biosynthesis enzyme MoaA
MALEDIGFYTLSDKRAQSASVDSPLSRCELILTDRCNFNCPYCRGPKHEREPFMPYQQACRAICQWAEEGLSAIRFSGGEPTMHPRLWDLVSLANFSGIEHIAISTNGSASLNYYEELIRRGVNDFSISLDASNPKLGGEMSGRLKTWKMVVANIKALSELTYVTTGLVFTEHNVHDAVSTVIFAHNLGVSDIRVLSSAQFNEALEVLINLPQHILDAHPILKYRVENFRVGRNVRGLKAEDSSRCHLVLDDIAVAGEHHFPCIIYLREGGDPIGKVGPDMRKERAEWCENHNTQEDPICSENCLDVCIDYNNTVVRRSN